MCSAFKTRKTPASSIMNDRMPRTVESANFLRLALFDSALSLIPSIGMMQGMKFKMIPARKLNLIRFNIMNLIF